MVRPLRWFSLVALLAIAPLATAATYTVTNTNTSGSGSLVSAGTLANFFPGVDTIVFDIPGAGPHTIPVTSFFFVEAVIIDGYTQPGSSAPTNSFDEAWNGDIRIRIDADAGASTGLLFQDAGSTLRGISVTGFPVSGIELAGSGGHLVTGCLIGLTPTGTADGNYNGIKASSANNVIGGTIASTRNVISGNDGTNVWLTGNSNLVRGNFVGPDLSGTTAAPHAIGSGGINVDGDNCTIGDASPDAPNVISGNETNGIWITSTANNTTVENNSIGADADRTSELPNGDRGIRIDGTNSNIGVASVGGGNVIGGNAGEGIRLINGSTGTNIVNNQIGGTFFGVGNQGHGIVSYGGEATIGGTLPLSSNSIQFNGLSGIAVSSGGGIDINRNSIERNDELGIDLGLDGVTPNDPGDADTGPNGLQNFPELSSVEVGVETTIHGTLPSPNGSYDLNFYSSLNCDILTMGHGEGEQWLGVETLVIASPGDENFSITLPVEVEHGDVITATATDAAGNTSEFSACLDIDCGSYTVTNTSSSGPGSLFDAIENMNACPNLESIFFNLPGPGPHTIVAPPTIEPITRSLTIDGRSQTGWAPCTNHENQPINFNLAVQIDLSGCSEPFIADGVTLSLRGLDIVNAPDAHQNAAVRVVNGGTARIFGCRLGDNYRGVHVLDGTVIFGDDEYPPIDYENRSVLVGSTAEGILIESTNPASTRSEIRASLIGLEGDPQTPNGNGIGVALRGAAPWVQIGGVAGRNWIASNGTGVWIEDSTQNEMEIVGNNFGMTTSFDPRPNTGDAIYIEDSVVRVEANYVANNGGTGIRVPSGEGLVHLYRNATADNGALGIDLGPAGVTTSGALMLDVPVLTSAMATGGDLQVTGTITGNPGQTIFMRYFHNDLCDPSGYGEGQRPLDFEHNVFIGPTSTADVDFTVAVPPAYGPGFVTAIAYNTAPLASEFSACIPIVNTPSGMGVVVEPVTPAGDQPATITFADVTGSGYTHVEPAGAGLPALPNGFELVGGDAAYEITSDVTFNGSFEICLDYDAAQIGVAEADLELWHYDTTLDPDTWVDITTNVDEANDRICGVATSFSPFALLSHDGVTSTPDLPRSFALRPAVPNPFNPSTTIAFELPKPAHVKLTVYSVSGRAVATLVDAPREAGVWTAHWDGRSDDGGQVASGVYYYRIVAGDFTATEKMVLLK